MCAIHSTTSRPVLWIFVAACRTFRAIFGFTFLSATSKLFVLKHSQPGFRELDAAKSFVPNYRIFVLHRCINQMHARLYLMLEMTSTSVAVVEFHFEGKIRGDKASVRNSASAPKMVGSRNGALIGGIRNNQPHTRSIYSMGFIGCAWLGSWDSRGADQRGRSFFFHI